MKPFLVPVDLGGSAHRCLVTPPRRPAPTPELVQALITHYLDERAPSGPVEVAFFHGGMPCPDLLAAARPHAVRLALTPRDLAPDMLEALGGAGVRTVEINALTFDTSVLRGCRRGYSGRHAKDAILGLRDRGFRVGLTLAPGLPGASHGSLLEDVRWVVGDGAPRVDFVRVLPAVAFAGAGLARRVAEGRWTPMSLGEAVTTVVELLDRFEDAGVDVARVGVQAGQDVPGRVVAGPHHPDLRGLGEARRFRRKMRAALCGAPRTRRVQVAVNPKDLSWAKGPSNSNVRALRADLGLEALQVRPREDVPRGVVRVG